VIDETLTAYLHDGRDAWQMLPDGHYERVSRLRGKPGRSAQDALSERYGSMVR